MEIIPMMNQVKSLKMMMKKKVLKKKEIRVKEKKKKKRKESLKEIPKKEGVKILIVRKQGWNKYEYDLLLWFIDLIMN